MSAWCGIDFNGIASNPCAPRAAALYLNETILRDLVIPDDVEEIKQRAFYNCGSLRSVTIPKSVTSVGAYAFADCVSLQNVKVLAVKPPFAYANTFSNYNIELCVPINVLASYQDTAPWNKFGTISTVNISITDIVLNQSSITLSEGEALALTATINPDNATNQLVTWSSSDTCVATVDTNGKVTAIAPGTTVVTVTANDGSGVKASCEVMVVKIHYLVTFMIDNVVVASYSLKCGEPIVAPEAPEREGYTFSGWGEVPETMPAEDVIFYGGYTANVYKVYYFVGATLVHIAEVAYGETIPEYVYEPTGEGEVFVGWIGDAYETMPARDVTYTANIESGIDVMSTDNSQQSTIIYDLAGRRITNAEKLQGGIYIINGRKVFK